MNLNCFKACDIRGRMPDELDETLARPIDVAMAGLLGPGPVVLGRDVRQTSPVLQAALMDGFYHAVRDVLDIGLGGTEEVYFQSAHLGAAGGIMVTASHNPMDYNGMKLVLDCAHDATYQSSGSYSRSMQPLPTTHSKPVDI